MGGESRICEDGKGGFVLPVDGEEKIADAARAIIYALAMIYFFMGVSIVADVFMGSIEVITSRRRQVLLSTGRTITVRVWNDTVANLTLMALGSSAPEILLSVTELFKREMYAGELGPSTIVGSASFNLLVIIALCMFVIPSTETRRIREMEVFVVTLVFMFFAYLWIVIIVEAWTPGTITIVEAVITLSAMLPLVYLSFLADVGKLGSLGCHRHRHVEVSASEIARVCELLGSFDRDTKEAIRMGLGLNPSKKKHLDNPTSQDMEALRKMVKKYMVTKRSRAARRIEATRALTGSKRIAWDFAPTFGLRARVSGVTGYSHMEVPIVEAKGHGPSVVQFACESQCMCEGLTEKPITIVRTGDSRSGVKVMCGVFIPAGGSSQARGSLTASTSMASPSWTDGVSSAPAAPFANTALEQVNTPHVVVFEPGEDKKVVFVKRPEESHLKSFIVELMDVKPLQDGEASVVSTEFTAGQSEVAGRTESARSIDIEPANSMAPKPKPNGMGAITRTVVSLTKSQGHGKLAFSFERLLIVGAPEKQTMEVMVQRLDGCTGHVSCTYRTERLTAVPGYDFSETDGTLEFDEGVTEQFIDLEILPKSSHESKDDFLTVLEDAEGGAEFNPNNDGGMESEILTVSIGPCNLVHMNARAKMARWLDDRLNFDEVRLGTMEWREQFHAAIYCNGSPEEQKEASAFDWLFHGLALPWKLAFALVPPTTYCSGWVCFWWSLLFIGGLTAIIGDLAELFGCVIGLPNIVTAITFVALGTSMPDLFASKTAAMQDPFADASIVNVTGSNSVNVFLGLGLPWSIGAVYWHVSEWDSRWAETYREAAYRIQKEGGSDPSMEFIVESGNLAFSVCVFAVLAMFALSIMFLRRFAIGGELGGPMPLKVASSLCMFILWVIYIALSSWWALREGKAGLTEGLTVFASCGGLVLLSYAVFLFFIIREIAYGDLHNHRHHDDHKLADGSAGTASYMGNTNSEGTRSQAYTTEYTTEGGTQPPPKQDAFSENAEAPEVASEGMNAKMTADETAKKEVADESCSAAHAATVALELHEDGHANGNGTTMPPEASQEEASPGDAAKGDEPSFSESQAALCRIQALRRAGESLPTLQPPLTHEMVVAESPVSPNTCCCSMKLAQ